MILDLDLNLGYYKSESHTIENGNCIITLTQGVHCSNQKQAAVVTLSGAHAQ